jgi:hypothetical protein
LNYAQKIPKASMGLAYACTWISWMRVFLEKNVSWFWAIPHEYHRINNVKDAPRTLGYFCFWVPFGVVCYYYFAANLTLQVGIAETGSGKTLAFLLPAIVHINARGSTKICRGPIPIKQFWGDAEFPQPGHQGFDS